MLLDKFTCLVLNENLFLFKFLSRFFHLVAFIWEFKVLKVISIFPRSSLGFCIYSIRANLNSPFSTIGKATADKITAENV